MADDVTGTGEGQPADDIRSAIAGAIASSQEAQAATAGDAAKPAKTAENLAEKPAAADGVGDVDAVAKAPAASADKGEKKPAVEKDAEPAKAGTDAEKPEAKAEPEKDAQAEADKKARAELTGKWSAKDKETFAKLPAEGQELLLRRHKEMEGAFTKKTQELAASRKEYEVVDKLFEPWADRMKAAGFTKSSMIQAWANVEQRLMNAADAPNVVAGIIKGYKIDLGKVAALLGIKASAGNGAEAPTADGTQPEAPKANGHAARDPELERELADLRSRADARDRADQEATRRANDAAATRVMDEIEKFKSATDKDGNLLHPHFEEVEGAMAQLASAAIAAKQPAALVDLYEKAVWANPSTRDAMLAAREQAQREKADAEARAKAAAARKAASSVTGAPGTSPAPTARRQPERSLREELVSAAGELS